MSIEALAEVEKQETTVVSEIAANPLGATVRAIQAALTEAGPKGRVQFAASTELVTGLETSVDIRGFKLTVDEPPSLGGTNLGANPVELVLAALGTCQEIVYATFASILDVKIDHLDIQVVGNLDPRGFYAVADVPAGFDSIEYRVNLVSSSPEEKIRQLINTVNAHCPVLDNLQRPIPVQGLYQYNGKALE